MRFIVKRIMLMSDKVCIDSERDRYSSAPVPASMAFGSTNALVRGRTPKTPYEMRFMVKRIYEKAVHEIVNCLYFALSIVDSAFFSSICIADSFPENALVKRHNCRILAELLQELCGYGYGNIMLQAEIACYFGQIVSAL